jgi:Endonuclease-reverse transcriptase
MFSIMYQNVAGSNATLEGLVSSFSFVDIFVIGEVPQWAGECRKMKGMYFVGKDGEGRSIVGMYVRERAIGALVIEEVEKHWIGFRIRRKEGDMKVVGVYAPQKENWAKEEGGWRRLRDMGDVMVGDTNARHPSWDPWYRKGKEPGPARRRGEVLAKIMGEKGWRNLTENLATRESAKEGIPKRSCIDHVWTNQPTQIRIRTGEDMNSDHRSIRLEIPGNMLRRERRSFPRWHKADWGEIEKALGKGLGGGSEENGDPQKNWERMRGKVEEIVEKMVPMGKANQAQASWWGPELEKMRREAGRAHRAWKTDQSMEKWRTLRRTRLQYKAAIRKAKTEVTVETWAKRGPSEAMRDARPARSRIPVPIINWNGNRYTTNSERALIFHQKSSCEWTRGKIPVYFPLGDLPWQDIPVDRIKPILDRVPNNKAPGPDQWPASLVKHIPPEPIADLYNGSIRTGVIPTSWKEATAVIIPKSQKPAHTLGR